ncbi:MAG: AzlD domain-containing protein [Actinobacteria bacterium]|nr:AzlD domain-containing protein [Actinomycetota bacterium]
MTWAGLLIVTVGNALNRLAGLYVLGRLGANERWIRPLALLPLSIVAAVVAMQTFAVRQDLVVDARSLGVAVAGLLAWRRVPLVVVVVAAAAVTALARRLGWT